MMKVVKVVNPMSEIGVASVSLKSDDTEKQTSKITFNDEEQAAKSAFATTEKMSI